MSETEPTHADHVPTDLDSMPRRWLADLVGNGALQQAGRNEDLQLRLDEREAVEEKLALRERELVRREEAAARWFRELNRIQCQLEEKQQRLDARGGAAA